MVDRIDLKIRPIFLAIINAKSSSFCWGHLFFLYKHLALSTEYERLNGTAAHLKLISQYCLLIMNAQRKSQFLFRYLEDINYNSELLNCLFIRDVVLLCFLFSDMLLSWNHCLWQWYPSTVGPETLAIVHDSAFF